VIPDEFLDVSPEIILPPEQRKAWLNTRTGAIVGRKTAEKFHWKIGDKIPIQSSVWSQANGSRTWEFDLVGIFDGKKKGTDTTPLFFRYDFFDEGRGSGSYGKGMVGWYTIKIKDPSKAAETALLVDKEFENSDAETKTEPEGAFVQAWASQIGNIALMVGAILGAVFFTILLVAGNTMSQAVRERTGELGVLKAIGFTNFQVVAFVLVESCLLSVLGGGLGLGLAWLVISRGDPTGGLLPFFFFPWRDVLIGVGLALALGLATGIFPALQTLRLRVADALRRM
jgi:putative ABC transport system permease protein